MADFDRIANSLERIADALEVLASAERRRMTREVRKRKRKRKRQTPKPRVPQGPENEEARKQAIAALRRAGVVLD